MKFSEGVAVIGKGWLIRVWRLRIIWAPTPDPKVTRVVADETETVKITINWEEGERYG